MGAFLEKIFIENAFKRLLRAFLEINFFQKAYKDLLRAFSHKFFNEKALTGSLGAFLDKFFIEKSLTGSLRAFLEKKIKINSFLGFRNASFTSTFRGIGSGTGTGGDCKIQHLIIVFHGGSVLDMNTDPTTKRSDLTTFRGVLEFVMRQHYPSLVGHIAVKQVTCPDTCSDILNRVSNINPYSFESTYAEGPLVADTQIGIVPLLLASKKDFPKIVDECIFATNKIFDDFLHSDEGCGFHGQVTIIGDSIGSVIAYDALTRARGVKSVPTLDVHVTDFFIFGSPLALILQMRAYATEIFHPTKPNCVQIYNLFHPTDPVSCRLEPLLYNQMAKLSPVNVVRYVKHPRGNMEVLQLGEFYFFFEISSSLKSFPFFSFLKITSFTCTHTYSWRTKSIHVVAPMAQPKVPPQVQLTWQPSTSYPPSNGGAPNASITPFIAPMALITSPQAPFPIYSMAATGKVVMLLHLFYAKSQNSKMTQLVKI